MRRRWFTVEEANAALATVRPLTERVIMLSRLLPELHEDLRIKGYRAARTDAGGQEAQAVATAAAELRRAEVGLTDALHQLTQQGVDLKDAMVGVVDFPSLRDGEAVELCWRAGEEQVSHWHPVGGGYAGRRPLR